MRDRLCIFLGGTLALLGAVVLVFAGSRLLYVVQALTEPPSGLGNDLNLAQLAAAVLGVGLCLVIYALGVARRVRRVNRSGRLGMAAAGIMIVLAGALLVVAFGNVAGDLDELDRMGRLKAGHSELPGDIARIIALYGGQVQGGFWILLSAQLVLGISLWSLFWSRSSPRPPGMLTAPAVWSAVAAAVAFASLFFLATITAGDALVQSPPEGNHGMATLTRDIGWVLLSIRGGLAGLIVYGVVLFGMSLLFRGAD